MKEQENTRIELIEDTSLKDVSVCFELKFCNFYFLKNSNQPDRKKQEAGQEMYSRLLMNI